MFLIIFILLFTKSNLIREENMAEYQILNLMQIGFIQNAMYFVGMVLFYLVRFQNGEQHL